VPADVFGEAVDAEVRPLRQRLGPQRTEESIVDRDRRPLLRAERRIARGRYGFDVDQCIRGVSRAFEIDERDPALFPAAGNRRVDLLARRSGGEIDPRHAEAAEDFGDQGLGRGI